MSRFRKNTVASDSARLGTSFQQQDEDNESQLGASEAAEHRVGVVVCLRRHSLMVALKQRAGGDGR